MIDNLSQANNHSQLFSKIQTASPKHSLTLFSPKNHYIPSLNKAFLASSSDSMPNLTKNKRIKAASHSVFNTNNKISSSSWKSLEKLHQQNNNQKLSIQNPNPKLGNQRIRKEITLKNIKRIHQKLNTQYCEQIFMVDLPNRSHLVEGVKHQYYNLKQKYEQKCIELNELHRQTVNAQYHELKVYCQALQKENLVLKKRVEGMLIWEDKLFKELQFQQHMEIAQDGGVQVTQEWIKEQELNMVELLGVSSKIATLDQRAKQTIANMEKLKEKMQVQRQLLRQRKCRIHFLEAAFKRKQNELHEAKWKSSRQLKEKEQIAKRLHLSLQQQQARHSQAIQALSAKYKKKLETQKEICQRYLKQSQNECESFKREMKRMSILLSSFRDNCQCHSANINIGRPEVKDSNSNQVTDNQDFDKFLITFQKQADEHLESQTFKQKRLTKDDK